MPTFTVPINGANGPGFVTVNANDAASATQNVGAGNVATGAPISGGPANIPGGGGGAPSAAAPSAPTSTVGAAAPNSAAVQLGNSITQGANLLNSGSKQAFDEYVREFNANFGLNQAELNEKIRQYNEGLGVTQAGLTGTYQGQQTQQAQLQAANIAAQQAGLTGYYNAPGAGAAGQPLGEGSFVRAPDISGAPGWSIGQIQNGRFVPMSDPGQFASAGGTPDMIASMPQVSSQQFVGMASGTIPVSGPGSVMQGTPTLAREQQTFSQQLSAINAAAALQANPFRQQQVIGQLGPLLTGIGGVAGFQAPNTVAGVGTMGQRPNTGPMNSVWATQPGGGGGGGGGGTGMAYMQQMIDDIRSPGANQASMQGVLNAIPTPNKINSPDFLRSAPSTQNLVLQGMQEKYGLDPADSLAQIKNTLPSFNAPTTFGQIKG